MTTTQAVSKALTKAGHRKSETTPTAIRGLTESSRGFKARKWNNNGTVSVEYRSGLFRNDPNEDAELEKYAQSLRDAGFTVTEGEGLFPRLMVTKP